MKLVCASLLALLLTAAADNVAIFAQNPAVENPATSSSMTQTPGRATVQGVVTKDPSGEPAKKVLIELIAETQGEAGNYTAVTGADGVFHIEGVVPGRYRLFAERTGSLEVDKHRPRADGRLLTLTAGQEVKGLLIRLQATAVIEGRVTDEDGDPLPNADVAVLRQRFAAGRTHWEQTGGGQTNDLGEYRIANLPAGGYSISVTPPPDFRNLIEAASSPSSIDKNADGAPEKRMATTYMTTYYPGTRDRSQASLVQLHAGDDFPANFSLTPTPSLTVRGTIVNLPAGAAAEVMLRSKESGLMLNGGEMHKDGSFEIRGVPAGAYTVMAMASVGEVSLMAREPLQLISQDVDDLRLAPQTGAWLHGRLRLESKGNLGKLDPGQIFLSFSSQDGDDDMSGGVVVGEGFVGQVRINGDGSFEWKGVPPGHYYVQLAGNVGGSADLFLKSVVVGSRDVTDTGFSVNGGAAVLDVVASANGAVVDGVVANAKGEPVANAVVVAVPELRLRSRTDRYRKTVTDQSGRFTLHGVPPGAYTALAWESVDGEAYYNPEFLKNYEGQGKALQVSEGEHTSAQLKAIPVLDEELPDNQQ